MQGQEATVVAADVNILVQFFHQVKYFVSYEKFI